MPKSLQVSMTGAVLVKKTVDVKELYLKAHKTKPLLSPVKLKGLKNFTVSQQWCSNFMLDNW